MLSKIRRRAQDEQGFTLIELLVVILIIGILAAVAIPTFLNQRGKAYDSNAESLAKNAQIAAETYATNNNGTYPTTAADASPLETIDPTLTSAIGLGTADGGLTITNGGGTDNYVIVATAQNTGDTFTITETTAGVETNTCHGTAASGGPGACPTTGSW
jgi:type IV pilus assembly protein PilA